MAHLRRSQNRSIKGTIISVGAIMVAIAVCSVGFFGALDIACRQDINVWAPLYPDAELVEQTESGFLRPRASGLTEQTYYTPDAENDVEAWFRDYRRELTDGRFNAENSEEALGPTLATIQRYVVTAEDREGAYIIYDMECAYS